MTVPASTRRRREVAALARRRRLLLMDVALGGCVGLIALLAGFGLAPVGIVALLVLLFCVGSYAVSRPRRARRP
jgi:hypothetical protein